jgi:outer membrane protein assembly factor BamE (lipoprotein component of BamABCDE complex)
MVSTRERKSWSSILVFAALLTGLTWGCTIGRVYIGSEFTEDQQGKIVAGATTKGDILTMCGPPDTVRRQYDGDVFLYRYLRRNSSALDLTEPVVTRLTLFSFSRFQQKDDTLMILFDKDGVVKAYGFRRGTSELSQF